MGASIGSYMKQTMEENMKEQQKFMLVNGQMQMERQMAMQQLMQQKMMAVQLARSRELFNWTATFGSIVSLGCFGAARMNRKFLAPLLPISFVLSYQYDACYGNKMQRIRADAEYLLKEESDRVQFPNGKINFEIVEAERLNK